MPASFDLRLYLVTDRPLCGGRDVVEVAVQAARGGATLAQLREKQCSTEECVVLAARLKAVLDPLGVPLIVNDRVDVALAVGAAGVHLGQTDMPAARARALLGPTAVIGLSVESEAQARAAEAEPVDYLGVSPVFATSTKPDAGLPWGLEGLRRLRALSRHPLAAIGGIGLDNAEAVMAAGAQGVAVVSALCAAPDPESSARLLLAAVNRGASRR